MQLPFRKSWLFSSLLAAAILAARFTWQPPDRRIDGPRSQAPLELVPIPFPPMHGQVAIAGRWRISVADARFGGLSALALDGPRLLAITDGGHAAWLDRPGTSNSKAAIAPLPSGPGPSFEKAGRDSESLAADPKGRGWWVGFENGHEVRLFDRTMTRTLGVVSLRGFGWKRNRGAEGLVVDHGRLWAYPEPGRERIAVEKGAVRSEALNDEIGLVSDVANVPGGGLVAVTRTIRPLGISSRLLVRDEGARRWRELARLPLDRWSNPEGIAAEPGANGTIRLWLVSDNDFRRRVPTELIAVDWKR